MDEAFKVTEREGAPLPAGAARFSALVSCQLNSFHIPASFSIFRRCSQSRYLRMASLFAP